MNPNQPYLNSPDAAEFVRYEVPDAQHQGMTAVSFEHPRGWEARGQVVWNMKFMSVPNSLYALAFNPQGAESVEFLPMEAFFWLKPDLGFYSPGQNNYGMTCMPPTDAADAMTRLVIPKYRGDRRNLRIDGVQPMPNLLRMINAEALAQLPTESVVARVEYEEEGVAFEELFFGVLNWNESPGGMGTQVNWGFARLLCFRAERGRLGGASPTLWRVARSFRYDPQWLQLCEQIRQQLNAQFQQMHAGFREQLKEQVRFSQQLSAYNQQLREQRSQSVADSVARQRQQNAERSQNNYTGSDAFGDALAGRTAYHDPNSATGNYYYDHGYYKYVYTDRQGNFHGTNDPSEDPNVNSDRNWYPATPVEPNS
ncbi:MAG TPA: hypothetical protein VEQ42_04060 [Pyrinomonadaceae bacterium]|nr:hypothetical protein [Pyrinomonadaceae bacterium]